jgi:uncharacterized protein
MMWQRIFWGKAARSRWVKILTIGFIIVNLCGYIGSYYLTHTRVAGEWGLGKVRSVNSKLPTALELEYTDLNIPIAGDLKSEQMLALWSIPARTAPAAGTILLFHGNDSSKSSLIASARVFHDLNYDCLLVDFRGAGDSTGTITTVGLREAEDVKTVFDYARSHYSSPLILYGISMGSAAIMRSIAVAEVRPAAVILELPYLRLIDSIGVRLKAFHLPKFPLAHALVFWGGTQHGYDGFAHNPIDYADRIKCPSLILHGRLDRWVTVAEIESLFDRLPSPKELAIFPTAGHNLLVTVDRQLWRDRVGNFMAQIHKS